MNKLHSTFLEACHGRNRGHIPVWFMRQAGRYLPEYRRLRAHYDILTICRTPELAAEVTLQPIRRFPLDAAIIFADISLLPMAMGVKLSILDSVGPVLDKPLRSSRDIKRLRELKDYQEVSFIIKTIRLIRENLRGKIPLIGFSGAPFTLASYIIEGKPSKDFSNTKSLMYGNTALWRILMDKLTNSVIKYLIIQIEAGVEAVQLFDSWVGCLSRSDYRRYVLPWSERIFKQLQRMNVPTIHFGTNTAHFLKDFASVNSSVVGVDWRVSIREAAELIGRRKAIQGNLDPSVLLAPFPIIRRKVDELSRELSDRRRYIFNLGHGILPQTPVENVERLVEYVHSI